MKSTHIPLRLFSVIAVTGLLGVATASAQLATYDFSSSTSPASPTAEVDNLSASSVAWNGLTTGTFGVSNLAGGQAFARFDSVGTTFDENKYLSFTVTADEGYLLNLSSLTVSFGGTNTSTTVGRAVFAKVRTDAEDTAFSTDLAINPGALTTASVAIPANTTTSSIVYEFLTVDLSDAAYQSVSALTIRLYGYASSTATTGTLRVGDITINGAVTAIPEPSSYALLAGGVALGSILCLRRRNRCK